MAHVRFLKEAVLEGTVYVPGQEAEIADVWVYPLLRAGMITCPGPMAPTVVQTRDPWATHRDPVVQR